MTQKLLHSRAPAGLIARGGDAFTLAISRDASVRWALQIIAHLEHGSRNIGTIYTQPYAISGAPPCRVIAAGCLPGATAWSVDALCLDQSATTQQAVDAASIELDLSVGMGMQVPSFVDFEVRTTNYRTGMAGAVILDQGQRLRAWSAIGAVPGAMAQLNFGPAIAVAVGAAVTSSNLSIWNARMMFVGTSQYLVEVEG